MNITPDDLAIYLREPAASMDPLVVQQLVDLTNNLVNEVVGVTAVETARVTTIRLAVGARAYYNPRGLQTESMDAHGWPSSGGRSGVYLTDEERAELLTAPVAPTVAPGPWAGSLPYRSR